MRNGGNASWNTIGVQAYREQLVAAALGNRGCGIFLPMFPSAGGIDAAGTPSARS